MVFLKTVGFIISENINLPLFDLKRLDSFSTIFHLASYLWLTLEFPLTNFRFLLFFLWVTSIFILRPSLNLKTSPFYFKMPLTLLKVKSLRMAPFLRLPLFLLKVPWVNYPLFAVNWQFLKEILWNTKLKQSLRQYASRRQELRLLPSRRSFLHPRPRSMSGSRKPSKTISLQKIYGHYPSKTSKKYSGRAAGFVKTSSCPITRIFL